jgi:hypothetical protein
LTPDPPDSTASALAERILQRIYGDDFVGCNVDPAEIASMIEPALKGQTELLDLYDKVLEAIDLLSTPPETGKIADPAELRSTLTQRLDTIHDVTIKTRQTVAKFNANR